LRQIALEELRLQPQAVQAAVVVITTLPLSIIPILLDLLGK
jgi:hypothetical protein